MIDFDLSLIVTSSSSHISYLLFPPPPHIQATTTSLAGQWQLGHHQNLDVLAYADYPLSFRSLSSPVSSFINSQKYRFRWSRSYPRPKLAPGLNQLSLLAFPLLVLNTPPSPPKSHQVDRCCCIFLPRSIPELVASTCSGLSTTVSEDAGASSVRSVSELPTSICWV